MNTRIRELAEKAGTKFPLGGFPNYDCFDCEQFAELIVRECMNTIATSNESRQTAYYYRNLVAEHFGVDE